MAMNKLTPKQRKFCLEYLKDFNATRAAVDAGYSKRSAKEIGSGNLTKHNVQEHLSKKINKAEQMAEIDIALILKHLYNMAFFDARTLYSEDGDLLPMSEWPPEAGKLVQDIDVQTRQVDKDTTITIKKIKIPSRERNTENLGRYLAMFTDKIKDVSDPKEMLHFYVPQFRGESEPIIPGNNGGNNGGNGRDTDED